MTMKLNPLLIKQFQQKLTIMRLFKVGFCKGML